MTTHTRASQPLRFAKLSRRNMSRPKRKMHIALTTATILAAFLLIAHFTSRRVAAQNKSNEQPIIAIQSGKLQGTLSSDQQIRIYRGIPFANPPVGDLRWKPPVSRPPNGTAQAKPPTSAPAACKARSSTT